MFKHSSMILYSDTMDLSSHRTRIVLAEKGVSVNIIYLHKDRYFETLPKIYHQYSLPILIDRDLVLYEAGIITEYLDERFPHPPLLPVYPVSRAKCRLLIHNIEQSWMKLISNIEKMENINESRIKLLDQLILIAPFFDEVPYFFNEDFSLADCCLAPILWRLKYLGIELPKQMLSLNAYMKRVFSRASFEASLTDLEKECSGGN